MTVDDSMEIESTVSIPRGGADKGKDATDLTFNLHSPSNAPGGGPSSAYGKYNRAFVAETASFELDEDEDIDEEEVAQLLSAALGKGRGVNAQRNKARKQKQKERKKKEPKSSIDERVEIKKESPSVDFEDVKVKFVEPTPETTERLLSELDAESREVMKGILTRFGSGADTSVDTGVETNIRHETKEDEGSGLDESEDESGTRFKSRLSRRAQKRMLQDYVSLLKTSVQRPDVIEVQDVTSPDPYLLVWLKSYRNTVPVPRHWCHKRGYLQNKRGIVKPPFELPGFILDTGITKLRDADIEAQEAKNLKAKTRERVRPKVGKVEIDYNILHDAFFVHQTKPKLSSFGDLYYEGKELVPDHSDKVPGALSERLRLALGMREGAPPPWLFLMQRYGPPPSYPFLRIPGLNAPIPEGASFGYGPGQWGQPPINEKGEPLYGDVFGQVPVQEEAIPDYRWGAQSSVSRLIHTGIDTTIAPAQEPEPSAPAPVSAAPPAQVTTIPTLDASTVRKPGEAAGPTPALYTVLEEKKTDLAGSLLGTRHGYDLSKVQGQVPTKEAPEDAATDSGVSLSIDPDSLATITESEIRKAAEVQEGVGKKRRFDGGSSRRTKELKF